MERGSKASAVKRRSPIGNTNEAAENCSKNILFTANFLCSYLKRKLHLALLLGLLAVKKIEKCLVFFKLQKSGISKMPK